MIARLTDRFPGRGLHRDGGQARPLPEMAYKTMADITSPTVIKIKGGLFLLAGIFATVLLLMEHPTLKVAALLAISVWCFCRFYYFAFYVIEHYVDPGYRFAGLGSLVRYMLRKRKQK